MREFLLEHGSILLGLIVGTLAHFGRMLSANTMPTLREAAGFVLQLALVGLLSAVATKQLGIHEADYRALVTAILAVSTNEVLGYLRENGWLMFARSVTREDRDNNNQG